MQGRHIDSVLNSLPLCFTGAVLAVASNDGTVKMYEVANGKVSLQQFHIVLELFNFTQKRITWPPSVCNVVSIKN